ncbi:hypothetical protein SAMN05421664_0749 [Chryseobacterium soldanellicola]|uniref:Uncharacterized protein n=1 Tax=Chryseobacterium soldanellicola TaxID=311333 RepID=A0A1H0YIC0_9FLAO|nr:hypothetical protein [Chryseobacterium soldanellicola]SDQ15005.1 hypothetical protein SAMN05421664_0749 [Chryseobacterium soldanellicola]
MKNKITLTCFALSFASFANAQVGINTPNPASTFDIVAKSATGTSKAPEGLLVPRIDRLRAQSMDGIATSTLIFVNNATTGTQTGKAVNINSVGYYYFDGTNWIKLNSGTINDKDTNIYNSNGSLAGNRTVAQNANTLAFTGSAINAFSVDGNTFSVDAANNRVGIGTTSPNNLLDLGQSNGKKLALWNSTAGDDFYGFGAAANVLQIFAGAPADGNALMTLNKTGKVGIGTTNPQTNFHTIGTRRFENATPGSVTVGSVLTATDGNGTAEWKTPVAEAVVGALTGSGINIPFVNNSDYKYTGRYITLPPGRWAVTITQLAQTVGTLDTDDWMFVRSTFTDQNVAVGAVATRSADVNGGPSLMSFRVQGPGVSTNPQQFDVFQGAVFINNTSGANKTYRYIVGATVTGGGPNSATTIQNFGGTWSESSIYATAIK